MAKFKFDEIVIKSTTAKKCMISCPEINTPTVRIPFPIKDVDYNGRVFVHNMTISMDSPRNNQAKIQEFEDLIQEIDYHVIELLPKSVTENRTFRPSLYPGTGEYKPTMSISIPATDENVRIYSDDKKSKEYITVDTLKEKYKIVQCLIRVDCVWISADKYGINWVARQIKGKIV